MKSFTIVALLLLAIGFAGILIDYKPNQHATALSYWSCVPLLVGVATLVGAAIKNSTRP